MTDPIAIMQAAQCRDEPTRPPIETQLALTSALTALRRARPSNGTDAEAISAARRQIVKALRTAA